MLAACVLRIVPTFTSTREAKRNLVRAVERVAQLLGNTPAICRKSYVHPAVIDAYLDGRVVTPEASCPPRLAPDEAGVLALLEGGLHPDARSRVRAAA